MHATNGNTCYMQKLEYMNNYVGTINFIITKKWENKLRKNKKMG